MTTAVRGPAMLTNGEKRTVAGFRQRMVELHTKDLTRDRDAWQQFYALKKEAAKWARRNTRRIGERTSVLRCIKGMHADIPEPKS